MIGISKSIDSPMKLRCHRETDSLYIDLADRPAADSREIQPGVVLDFDAAGLLVGIDIDCASQVASTGKLELVDLPMKDVSVA